MTFHSSPGSGSRPTYNSHDAPSEKSTDVIVPELELDSFVVSSFWVRFADMGKERVFRLISLQGRLEDGYLVDNRFSRSRRGINAYCFHTKYESEGILRNSSKQSRT
jgi:hypothetical protein